MAAVATNGEVWLRLSISTLRGPSHHARNGAILFLHFNSVKSLPANTVNRETQTINVSMKIYLLEKKKKGIIRPSGTFFTRNFVGIYVCNKTIKWP